MGESTPQHLARHYAPAVLNRLGRLPSKDQLPIASWLIKFPIGTNYAMQVLECLEDLSRKEAAAPSRILHQILLPMTDYEGHPKELGRQVRDALHKRLHPASAVHQERFRVFVKQLGLPEGVKLHPPKNFEGTTYQMTIEFESPEQLEEKLKILEAILQQSVWEPLEEF
jgi:hypothetical protein